MCFVENVAKLIYPCILVSLRERDSFLLCLTNGLLFGSFMGVNRKKKRVVVVVVVVVVMTTRLDVFKSHRQMKQN